MQTAPDCRVVAKYPGYVLSRDISNMREAVDLFSSFTRDPDTYSVDLYLRGIVLLDWERAPQKESI